MSFSPHLHGWGVTVHSQHAKLREKGLKKKKKIMCRLSPWVWGINVKSVRKGINRLTRCWEPGQSWAMIPEVAEHDLHTTNAVVQNTLLFLQCVGWPGSRSCCRGALGKAESFQCCLEKAQASPFSPPSFSRVFLDCSYGQELSSHCCPVAGVHTGNSRVWNKGLQSHC